MVIFAFLSLLGFLLLFIAQLSYPIALTFLANPSNFEGLSRWRCRMTSKFPRLSFLTRKKGKRKKKRRKNDQTGTQTTVKVAPHECVIRTGLL